MQRNLHCFFRSEGRLIAGTIRFFDLFSGIGGFREGLQRAGGFTCVGHCEADAYADHNYRVLFDTEGEWFCNDARNIETERMPDFDLLCAGFPCQAFSIAGRREGFADARGTLFFEVARLVADKRPAYFLLENVPGLLSHDKGRTFHTILSTLYGYILDEEPRYVDLSYRDQDTPVVVYDEDWQNNRQKVKVNVLKKEKDTDRVLKGGIFGLYTRNDILSASGKVLMEADTLIELKTTDIDGKISFIADLPIDGTYYVKELYAPDGFVTTGEEQEFVFEYQGDKEAEVSYEFVFEDEPTTVELSKTDLTTGEELPGARLQLTDENGAVVEEWTSTKEPHIIKELVVGKSYTLTETKPADGYATAESITFTVENTVEIQKQVMEDDVTKVEISKTDITGDNEIEGAKLTITDENGNIVETWTSGKEPHYIEKLPIGKYTLKEEQAPNGYVVSEEITFEVADTAEIQKVAMKDDTAKGRLIIEKTDKDTGAALKGAEFELRDADGKVVETLTTDENGHATSGLLAIGTYKDGKFDKAAIYYLVETKAPEGYQMDETKHEVTFTYVDDKTPVIEVIQKVTNEKLPEDTPSVSNPKTGDDTNLWFPALCLILSTGGLIGMGVASRRKKKKGGR